MRLFHFTSAYHLRGIGEHGLTVGDVPTDIDAVRGRIGVWLTSSETPAGHGLSGSRVDKTRFRLLVEVPETGSLQKWTTWAARNVTRKTMLRLEAADGFKADEFFLYFGWLPPDTIKEVVEMRSGLVVPCWQSLLPPSVSLPGISFKDRHRWQKRMLKGVRKQMQVMAAA
ncbi:hypothetical protein SB748_28995 [Rhizobium sp. SIMBA_035]